MTVDWHSLRIGESRICCPSCSRNPRDKTCGARWDGSAGSAHCFRCGLVESHRGDHQHVHAEARVVPLAPSKRETLSDSGRDLWNESLPLRGGGLAYLKARRCVIPPTDGDLRFHPELRHPCGHTGPALVGLVTDAVHAHAMSLHFTWVCADGSKADIDRPRMLLAGHRKAGGVIRLWPDDAVHSGLGLAEGIETALSLAHGFRPVWACVDAGNLAGFPTLPGIEALVVAVDHDDAGLRAAEQCALRWRHAGREVRKVIPPKRGQDLNDLARAA